MRTGTLAVFAQNLAVSGANQVLLNILKAGYYDGNIILVSPRGGPFAKFFQEIGVSVRVGLSLEMLLDVVPDVRAALANTIMTANVVLKLSDVFGIPVTWIVHEWWPLDRIPMELERRSIKWMTAATVTAALKAKNVYCAFICDALRKWVSHGNIIAIVRGER